MRVTQKKIDDFKKKVYAYYEEYGRKQLPWRLTNDSYKILVSEFMLQQTQVKRVESKYQEFLRAFPTVHALARATLRDVIQRWSGLGYNRRAQFLHKTAKIIVEMYDGNVPKDYDTLLTLPGIGEATAAEISAFGFGKAYPLIETNIRSVYIHHFFHDKKDVLDDEIVSLVTQTMDIKNIRKWYYALMDYGVMIKETYGNPSRKSKHYTKQSRFEGSDRQVRGKILMEIAQKQMTFEACRRKCDVPADRFTLIVDKMVKEGIIQKKGNVILINS